MQTAFQTLTIADGILAIKHDQEPSATPPTVVSPLRDLSRPLKSTVSSGTRSEDLGDFILEENYLEDSWGLHSSVVTSTYSYPEKSASSNSNLPETTSDQFTPVNSSTLLPVDSRMYYRLYWDSSDSELDSISFEDFSLEHFSPAMENTFEGYSADTYLGDDFNAHNSKAFI
ncbi:unnamed protein product [Cercopithifilaria johnstoni]|uniref:Uncharacterized protein n=1 Tax=Cercopithifilaria johnstoni TaxID=2874296 RepID=A0A8J2LZB2_9BILA|nr:unnamed protein product [Cercopithifilaria johnstoni]